jgi:nicotinate-nucleotide--dimethylbenzimidazole phosphoribosyltransferase
MKTFQISPVSKDLHVALQHKINNKTKPQGSLGKLESIALQVGAIQNTLEPKLSNPTIVVFAGDHGIAADGEVSQFPQEVTWQMVYNFLAGGAGLNVFAKQHDIDLIVVDAGVKHDFEAHPKLVNAKIANGTKNYLHEPAMTLDDAQSAIEKGAEIVRSLHATGTNVIGFGEMGIGNTSSASLLMSAIMNLPVADCVGAGAGLQTEGIRRKAEILTQVKARHSASESAMDRLASFGGFEIVMMCGAMLQAAECGMLLLIDGFIVTSALLVAAEMYPDVLEYCVFSHDSHEQGHGQMLNFLGGDPILDLDLRLGEGTGAALCYPLIESSLRFLNEMASFESASISSS